MVALARVDGEQPLLQVRVALVPERRREPQELVAINVSGTAPQIQGVLTVTVLRQ